MLAFVVTIEFLVDESICNGGVAVDTAIAQERPVATDVFQRLQVDVADEDFLAIMRALGQNTAEGVAEKRSSPEFESLPGRRFSADVPSLKSYAIDDGDIDSVGDGVRALDRAPGVVLGYAELGFLRGMPANRCGVKQNLGALERCEARSFGIPLVPTNERSQFAGAGVERTEAEISGSEIELFVVEGVVGDMHLAVETSQGSVFVENGGGVVVHARGTLFEEGGDQDNAILTGGCG